MKLMIIGAYSSLNKGDFAMHQVLIDKISEKIPKTEFDIMSIFLELDKKRYSQYFFNKKVYCRKNNLVNPIYMIWSNILSYFNLYKEFNKYDYVIDTSGDAMGESYSFQNTIYRILYLNLLKNCNKKLILAPQSVGPFSKTKYIFRNVLAHAEMIFARDPLSYKYLEGMKLNKIFLSGDLAFLTEQRETDINKKYLHKLRRIQGPKIGLNISDIIERFFGKLKSDKNDNNIGIGLCNYIYSNIKHCTIVFIPHVFGPGTKDDRVIGKNIYNSLPTEYKDRFILIEDEMDHGSLKSIIAELDMLISSRMHACIGAISTGTPLVNIAYSNKSVGLIQKYFKLSESCIDIRNANTRDDMLYRISNGTFKIWRNRSQIKKLLKKRCTILKKVIEKDVNKMCEFIGADLNEK